MSTGSFIRTTLKDQVSGVDDERGTRNWRCAEVFGDSWYLVERCIEHDGTLQVRRWVSGSVQECGRLLSETGVQWSRLLAYVRVPESVGAGFVFGEVAEIYEARSTGAHVLRFTNGMTIALALDAGNEASSMGWRTEQLSPIYSKSHVVGPFSNVTGSALELALD